MVASKGGVSYDTAMAMPMSERRILLYALAQTVGADVDWQSGKIKAPKAAQEAAARAKKGRRQ